MLAKGCVPPEILLPVLVWSLCRCDSSQPRPARPRHPYRRDPAVRRQGYHTGHSTPTPQNFLLAAISTHPLAALEIRSSGFLRGPLHELSGENEGHGKGAEATGSVLVICLPSLVTPSGDSRSWGFTGLAAKPLACGIQSAYNGMASAVISVSPQHLYRALRFFA